jgi:hypothetical protein
LHVSPLLLAAKMELGDLLGLEHVLRLAASTACTPTVYRRPPFPTPTLVQPASNHEAARASHHAHANRRPRARPSYSRARAPQRAHRCLCTLPATPPPTPAAYPLAPEARRYRSTPARGQAEAAEGACDQLRRRVLAGSERARAAHALGAFGDLASGPLGLVLSIVVRLVLNICASEGYILGLRGPWPSGWVSGRGRHLSACRVVTCRSKQSLVACRVAVSPSSL